MAIRGGFLCARTIYRERGRTTKPPLLLFHRCARTRESISILPGNLTSVKSHDINNSPSPSQPASGRVPPFFFSSFFYTLRGFRRRTRCKCFLMHTIVFFSFLFRRDIFLTTRSLVENVSKAFVDSARPRPIILISPFLIPPVPAKPTQ